MFYVSEIFTPAPETFQTPLQERTYAALAALGLPYERVETDEAITMEDCVQIDEKLQMKIVKTLFLCARHQSAFYLFVTAGDKPLRSSAFSAVLDTARVSFASAEKMWELLAIADRVEQRIGRKLEVISGGATSSFTLVHWGTMPEGINHLRIGENILLGKDLQVDWGIRDMDYLRTDGFTLRAEVVEVRDKPTYPIGEFAIDAFGRKPVYEDRGIRRRAILALGRADVGDLESLLPREPGLAVIGGSSDHCIVDVEDCPRRLEVGDVVEFSLCYSHMLYASSRGDMTVKFVN